MSRSQFLLPVVMGGVLLVSVPFVGANSIGPPVGSTGAPAVAGVPAEQTCARSGCHNAQVNNGSGQVEILGLPDGYLSGQTYELTVRLSSTSTQANTGRRWGFQLTAFREEDGRGEEAGTFTSPDLSRINVANSGRGTGRTYVRHLVGGVQQGQNSPVEWSFSWTAPEEDQGPIRFAAAGNATNGNGGTSGDFVYTTNVLVPVADTPVEPVTWGSIKAGARLRD